MQAVANAFQSYTGPAENNIVENKYKVREGGEKGMKALTWQGADSVKVIDADIPDITQDTDVILKVTATTICGSDLHLYHGEIVALQKGDLLGHEFAGIVDRVGPAVKNLKVGDRVVTSFQIACGECRFCKQKLSSFCDRTNNSTLMRTMYGGNPKADQADAGFFGYSHFTGGYPGGQAEWVKVPIGDVNCLKIPDEVPDEEAIYLSDILPTSYHNVVDTGVKEGDVVGVWGLGPIGQCSIRWALLKGAKEVVAIDCVPARLKMAEEAAPGKVRTLNFKEFSNVAGTLNEWYPGGLDVSLDCGSFHEPQTMLHKVEKALMLETDVSEVPNQMIMATRKMGRVGIIAAYAALTNHFNIGALMEKGIRFIGNGQAPVHLYWEEIMDMIKEGKWSSKFLVSHRIDVSEFAELYQAFDKRQGGLMKVFVQTRHSAPPAPGFPQLTSIKDLPKEVL